jgi:hypothetical protein
MIITKGITYSLIFMVASSFVLTSYGCGKTNQAIDSLKSNLENSALVHTWEREHCSTTPPELGIGGSYRVQYEFSGTEVKRNEQYFSSPECRDIAGLITYTGSFKTQKEIQQGVHELDMTYTKVSVAAVNETGKTFLNTAGFCDKKDWQVNQPVDLTNQAQERPYLNTNMMFILLKMTNFTSGKAVIKIAQNRDLSKLTTKIPFARS